MSTNSDDPGPCPLSIMWADYLNIMEVHAPAHELAQQKDAFYAAVRKVIDELRHYQNDPAAVRQVMDGWQREELAYLEEVLEKPDICRPGNPHHN